MIRRRRRALLPVLPLAALAAVVAACGGPSGSTTAPNIVATAPAGGGGITTGGGSTTGSSGTSVQTGGIRTVLAPLGLNLRDQPSTGGAVLGSLGEGTVVTVIGHSDAGTGWYQVKGATTTGWMTADPRFSSPNHFQAYESSQHGFSTLYPDSWNFSDSGAAAVVFTPQTASGLRITVATGASLDALGAPGKQGYAVSQGDSVEVFGVTGTIRLFDRGAIAPAGTTAPIGATPAAATPSASAAATGTSPDSAPHLAEIRLTVNATNAVRIDFEYQTATDLDLFKDVYNSMKLFAALPTATPAASPTP